ncbi:MAG: carboxypeptidase regulatory-like domain-containing protein [Chitinispirillaceae bacterium]|nr:carboxypeptidase regulatory-like domain-containing protein [Chitinispirillaceae bacterium]
MHRWVSVFCIMLLGGIGSVYSINISGKVTNSSGSAIRNAIVTLVTNELKDTTDQNGNFTLFDGNVGVLSRQMVPSVEALTLKKGIVHLSITEKTPVKMELFDMRGNLIRRIINHTLPTGSYRYAIASNSFARQMLALRVLVGQHSTTFRYLPLGNSYTTVLKCAETAAGELNTLAKIQATVDSIRVEATGYITKSIAVETLEGQVNVKLETMQALDKFSFFVTSLAALQDLSGSEDGFGGDFRFGHTGPGAGLKGADSICECIAERSMPGSKVKQWRAFLSVTADENGKQVNAIDRVGNGPWYDRVGRLLAPTKADLINARPANGDAAIMNDLPNEDGIPNHRPDPNLPEVDNHHMVTGSNTEGKLYSSTATCNDWTSTDKNSGKPQCGLAWPRGMGGFGGTSSSHWISSFTAGGCEAGTELIQNGAGTPGATIIGSGGGYGGFYCFALNP